MTPMSETPFGQAVAVATSSPFGVGGARFHYSDREANGWNTVYCYGSVELGCFHSFRQLIRNWSGTRTMSSTIDYVHLVGRFFVACVYKVGVL